MARSLLAFCLLWSLGCGPLSSSAESPESPPGFELKSGNRVLGVRAQTADEAYSYVVDQLGDMEFYQANGYDVVLPDHPAFGREASSPGSAEVFASEVYQAAELEQAVKILAEESVNLKQALEWFAANSATEGFRSFDRYEVILTLYGPGGSYDPETGTIVLFTTSDGKFKGGGGPHTIVHEMMHLAVEEGLVRRFGLSHWEKERLVDLLVQRDFSESLPDYKLQSLGEKALDPYVANVPLARVAEALERYTSDSQTR